MSITKMFTKVAREYLRPVLTLGGVCGLALAGSACAPVQSGPTQVPDINITINDTKDAGFVGMPAGVDAVMDDLLNATGRFAGAHLVPGCAVGIMQNNAISYVKGYGFANVEQGVSFTHVTPSAVGSVSKTWTALAALRLVELGLLDLDATVADYLPGAPAAWQPKTIRQLLSHTSGLAREPVFSAAIDTEAELSQYWYGVPGVPQLGIHPRLVWVGYTATPIQGFAPNTTARYSNAGYMIVGTILDTIAAAHPEVVGDFTTYERLVWRHVGAFDGNIDNADQMFSQSLIEYWRQTDIPNLASGYVFHPDTDTFEAITFVNSDLLQAGPAGWEGPPGGWTMTIGDLVRLMVAIQNDSIISAATKQNEMMDIQGSDTNGNWGLGVNLVTKLGRDAYMHDGKYPGYRARYTVWPDESFGVAIMCNEDETNMNGATEEIAKVFIGDGSGGIGGGTLSTSASPRVPILDDNDPPLAALKTSGPPIVQLTAAQRARVARPLLAELAHQRALMREIERRSAGWRSPQAGLRGGLPR